MAEIEPGVHRKQANVLVDPNLLDAESKANFLKRRAAEEKTLKKQNKVLEEWYCLGKNGNKLLKKVLKANGATYSFFMFRVDKNKKMFADTYKVLCKPTDYDPKEKWAEEIKKARRK